MKYYISWTGKLYHSVILCVLRVSVVKINHGGTDCTEEHGGVGIDTLSGHSMKYYINYRGKLYHSVILCVLRVSVVKINHGGTECMEEHGGVKSQL
jgi:hypothetical protein